MTATGYAVDQAVAAALSAVLASAFALQILVGWASASAQQAQQPYSAHSMAARKAQGSNISNIKWVTHRLGLLVAVLECVRTIDPASVDGLLPSYAVLWISNNSAVLLLAAFAMCLHLCWELSYSSQQHAADGRNPSIKALLLGVLFVTTVCANLMPIIDVMSSRASVNQFWSWGLWLWLLLLPQCVLLVLFDAALYRIAQAFGSFAVLHVQAEAAAKAERKGEQIAVQRARAQTFAGLTPPLQSPTSLQEHQQHQRSGTSSHAMTANHLGTRHAVITVTAAAQQRDLTPSPSERSAHTPIMTAPQTILDPAAMPSGAAWQAAVAERHVRASGSVESQATTTRDSRAPTGSSTGGSFSMTSSALLDAPLMVTRSPNRDGTGDDPSLWSQRMTVSVIPPTPPVPRATTFDPPSVPALSTERVQTSPAVLPSPMGVNASQSVRQASFGVRQLSDGASSTLSVPSDSYLTTTGRTPSGSGGGGYLGMSAAQWGAPPLHGSSSPAQTPPMRAWYYPTHAAAVPDSPEFLPHSDARRRGAPAGSPREMGDVLPADLSPMPSRSADSPTFSQQGYPVLDLRRGVSDDVETMAWQGLQDAGQPVPLSFADYVRMQAHMSAAGLEQSRSESPAVYAIGRGRPAAGSMAAIPVTRGSSGGGAASLPYTGMHPAVSAHAHRSLTVDLRSHSGRSNATASSGIAGMTALRLMSSGTGSLQSGANQGDTVPVGVGDRSRRGSVSIAQQKDRVYDSLKRLAIFGSACHVILLVSVVLQLEVGVQTLRFPYENNGGVYDYRRCAFIWPRLSFLVALLWYTWRPVRVLSDHVRFLYHSQGCCCCCCRGDGASGRGGPNVGASHAASGSFSNVLSYQPGESFRSGGMMGSPTARASARVPLGSRATSPHAHRRSSAPNLAEDVVVIGHRRPPVTVTPARRASVDALGTGYYYGSELPAEDVVQLSIRPAYGHHDDLITLTIQPAVSSASSARVEFAAVPIAPFPSPVLGGKVVVPPPVRPIATDSQYSSRIDSEKERDLDLPEIMD